MFIIPKYPGEGAGVALFTRRVASSLLFLYNPLANPLRGLQSVTERLCEYCINGSGERSDLVNF